MLHGLYAQSFNLKYDRVGHLFQSRYGSRRIHDEIQLAHVAGYILDNPVTAGLCAVREDWRWSGGIVSDGLLLPE
jgi:putative transposase